MKDFSIPRNTVRSSGISDPGLIGSHSETGGDTEMTTFQRLAHHSSTRVASRWQDASEGEKNTRRGVELCLIFLCFLLLKSLFRSR